MPDDLSTTAVLRLLKETAGYPIPEHRVRYLIRVGQVQPRRILGRLAWSPSDIRRLAEQLHIIESPRP
jgi:hypothetical protein